MWCGDIDKVVYGDAHKFLPKNHAKNSSGRTFIINSEQQLKQAGQAALMTGGNDSDSSRATGVFGIPLYCELEYWQWSSGFLLEPMHILLNQGEGSMGVLEQ